MSRRDVVLAGYALIVAAVVTLQLLSWRDGSRVPSLGELISRVMRSRAGRVGIVAGWAWIGIHFFAR